MEKLIMGIKDHRSINKALIRLNKINVVGGVNGSGKSTASRILYTFLKTYSSNRWEVAVSEIIDVLNGVREELIKMDIENESSLPNELKYTDNYSDIINSYYKLNENVENYLSYANNKKEELVQEMNKTYEILLKQLEKDFDHEFIIEHENYSKICQEKSIEILNSYYQVIMEFREKNENSFQKFDLDSKDDYFKVMEKSGWTKDFLLKNKIDLSNYDCFFAKIDGFDEDIQNLNIDLYENEMINVKTLISFLFSEDDFSRIHVMEELLTRESLKDEKKIDFRFFIEISDSEYLEAKDYFKDNGYIDDVFYFDNVSMFDLRDNNSDMMGFGKGRNIEHIEHILNSISNSNFDDVSLDEKTLMILEKIDKIIGGEFNINHNFFTRSLGFSNEIFETSDKNVISSGMKQIGTIQLLLLCNMLKEDTYLIIDEPEINLHPEWQFKFAEVLVLLAKDLNTTIYLNSHSPFFIEAIDAFTEFYDMQDDVNYYLTEKSEVVGKYNFNKIESDELYKIYDNLGKPYDLIDQLRLRKHLEE